MYWQVKKSILGTREEYFEDLVNVENAREKRWKNCMRKGKGSAVRRCGGPRERRRGEAGAPDKTPEAARKG